MKKIITTALSLVITALASAQVAPTWIKFSAPSNYQNYNAKDVSVGMDTVGNIYTAASVWDSITDHYQAMTVKHSPLGIELWKKFYDNNDVSNNNNGTNAVAVLVDKWGNSYVCGEGRHGAVSSRDFMVIKYDNAGNQVWIKYTDGGQNIDDYVTCAAFDAMGNIVIAGNASFQGTNQYDIMVVKINTAGTQQWNYLYDGATHSEDVARAIATDANNNVFITGNTYGTNKRNMISMKLNSSGANQWTKIESTAAAGDEYGYGIAADAAGNCYATGALTDWTTIKYGSTGSTIWTNHYTANDLSAFSDKKVLLDKAGNVIVTGEAFVLGGGHFTDIAVNKLNPTTGAFIWSVIYDFGGSDKYSSAVLDTLGNVYVCGYHDGPQAGDLTALAVSAAGIVGWHTTYSNTKNNNGGDRAYGIAVDKNRNVILAGIAQTRGSGSVDDVDVITLKFSNVTVGIKSEVMSQSTVSIYPNPCSDKLFISVTDKDIDKTEITIINSLGETVFVQKLLSPEQYIEIGHLAKGIYVVQILNGQSSGSKKLIIN